MDVRRRNWYFHHAFLRTSAEAASEVRFETNIMGEYEGLKTRHNRDQPLPREAGGGVTNLILDYHRPNRHQSKPSATKESKPFHQLQRY